MDQDFKLELEHRGNEAVDVSEVILKTNESEILWQPEKNGHIIQNERKQFPRKKIKIDIWLLCIGKKKKKSSLTL